jgi:hypothetical protein
MTTLRIRHELERRIEKQNHDDAKNGEEE